MIKPTPEYVQLHETEIYLCTMCGSRALHLIYETKEPICNRCIEINEEARGKK